MPLGEDDPDWVSDAERGLLFAEGHHQVAARLEELSKIGEANPGDFKRLPGDFSFIIFGSEGKATVVRSCQGLVPLYFEKQSHGQVTIATRIGDVARYGPQDPVLDPLVTATWTSGWGLFPEGRSHLSGVSILARGHAAVIEPGKRPRIVRYWDPRPERLHKPTAARFFEHAERLRDLLLHSLENDLCPDGGNVLSLSGGTDSAALGALAAGVVHRPVWSVSILPEDPPACARDKSYIDALAEQFQFTKRWESQFRQIDHLASLRAAPRAIIPIIHPVLCALPKVCAEAPVKVLFGGEFADEVCGSILTLGDWAAHTSLFDLLRGLRRLPRGKRDFLTWTKHRVEQATGRRRVAFAADLPEYIRPEIRAEYRQWGRDSGAARAKDGRPLRGLATSCEHDGWVAMNWEACSALGVRRSIPFFTREVLELAFECHPSEGLGPGTKRLLKAAVGDDVPARNLNRPKQGFSGGPNAIDEQIEWSKSLPPGLEAILSPEWLENAPKVLPYSVARELTQLSMCAEGLAERRRPARGGG